MTASDRAAIRISHLVKRFNGLTAVDDLSFEVHPGELFGFLGPNGAGKTTTINILCTLLSPSSGEAFVGGFDCLRQPTEVRRAIGIIFQDPSLDDRLTAWENLEFHGLVYGMRNPLRRRRMEEVLKLVELWDRRNGIVRTFSRGMKRRLEVARGLMHQPAVLFLDEPTIGLDPQTRLKAWETIAHLRKDRTMTFFLTTHYMEEAAQCDRVAIIDRGKLLALDSPGRLIESRKARNLEELFLTLTGRGLRDESASESEISRGRVRKMRRWA